MADVFISYNSNEYAEAIWVKTILEKHNISCWMAPEDIPGGSNYAKEIPVAIKNCKILVVVLSNKAQSSQWVPKEVDRAINEHKIVMPFQIENCELTDDFNFYLTNIQRYRAYESKEREIGKLLNDICAILNPPAPLPNPQPQPEPEPHPEPQPIPFRGSVFALSTAIDFLILILISVLFGNSLLLKLGLQETALLSFWGYILTGGAAALYINIKFRYYFFSENYTWKNHLCFCLLSLVLTMLGAGLYLLLLVVIPIAICILIILIFFKMFFGRD